MMQDEDKLLKSMQISFRQELGERLLTLSRHLADLEDTDSLSDEGGLDDVVEARRSDAITAMLRELHNLKGAARAVNITQIEQLCHWSEELLTTYQHTPGSALGAVIDLMYQSTGWFDQLLNQLSVGQSLDLPELAGFVNSLQANHPDKVTGTAPLPAVVVSDPAALATPNVVLASGSDGTRPKPDQILKQPRAAAPAAPNGDGSIRVRGSKLDDLMAASSELLVARLRMRQHRDEISALVGQSQAWLRLWRGVRGSYGRLLQAGNAKELAGAGNKDLVKLLQFVEVNQQHLKQHEDSLSDLQARFSRDLSYLSTVTDQLQFETRRLRLLPLSILMEELERAVRQLSRELGKQVNLVVHGAELEVDKKMLDELKAPLLHLLRNALDHGLESPSQRLHVGKPGAGTITVSFRQAGRMIELEVRDDGAGIEEEDIRRVIIEHEMADPRQALDLSRQNLLDYIFHSGFSTRSVASDVSGRGVGLDAVRETANRLGGNVSVESWPGSGTAFRFSLPNLLLTAEGILIKCCEQTYVLPVDSVERSFRLTEATVQTIGSRKYVLYEQAQLELNSLAGTLGLPGSSETANQYVVILRSRGQLGAFTVQALLKNQEVVIKSLSKPLVRVRFISGGTILADGSVALILNPDDLIRNATRPDQSPTLALHSSGAEVAKGARPALLKGEQHILVVDDSITTRTLEKNILEAAGFVVQTARNGLEALGYLRTASFDLVIADLEMPEMDGFTLTQKIRADERLLEVPVLIVTSLDTSEHKSKGMEAGADAYLVKSRFDQQKLLATVQQLV